ncbi:hypothetical protein ACLK1T_22065 [Escherichia coli]
MSNLGMGTVLIGDMGMPLVGVSTAVMPATRPDWMSYLLRLPKTRWTSAQLFAREHWT